MKKLIIVAIAVFCVACNQPPGGQGSSADASGSNAASGGAGSGDERFYGRERFTLVGTQTGTEAGSFTEHVRDWGRARAEIKDVTLSMMGVTRRARTRAIYTGAEVATVDLETGNVTLMTNPLYSQVVDAMRGRDGVEFGQAIMTQMGGRATGERGRYAGHECEYWELAQLGSRSCVTQWGATLHNVTDMAGVRLERTVTEVRMGDGGPEAAFEYDAARATQAPSLEDIRAKMRGN